ncbi:MAG: pyrroline-5-carboxylate reductase [Kiritimatiellae bacterium]|nr:pyrroline-5-carboxylate reductase [Kiritimatiellia bacterium]
MKYVIGLIGAGKMGGAILNAVLKSGLVPASSCMVCDARADALVPFAKAGAATTQSPADVVRACATTVLAVKPQDFDALLSSLAPDVGRGKLLVSIAAGKTLATMRSLLGPAPRLVRVMPNLAAQVGEGAMAYAPDPSASKADIRRVEAILGCCGKAIRLDESLFDAVTALGGSGPAFFAYALEAMARGGEALGLPRPEADALALQTMLGTARCLAETRQPPEDFIKAVCSPHGTTEAGMKVLARSSVATAFSKTLAAAARRSAELSK